MKNLVIRVLLGTTLAGILVATSPAQTEQNEAAQVELSGLKTRIETAFFKESIAFYSNIIGMKILDSWDDGDDKGAILGLQSSVNGAAFLELAYSGKNVDHSGLSLQFRVPDIEASADRLRGRTDFTGPEKRPWGSKYIYLEDPSGIKVILYEGKL